MISEPKKIRLQPIGVARYPTIAERERVREMRERAEETERLRVDAEMAKTAARMRELETSK